MIRAGIIARGGSGNRYRIISSEPVQEGGQSAITVPTSGSTTVPAFLHLPSDYATSGSQQYPMIVFFHGSGEAGTNLANIYDHSVAGGPAYEIMHNSNDMTYVNPYTGATEKFIVVAPQGPTGDGIQKEQVPFILAHLYATYRVNVERVHLTCISMGGRACVEYPGGLAGDPAYKVASIVPMSAALNGGDIQTMATKLRDDGVDVWGFGGKTAAGVWDTHGANTGTLVWWYTWELPPYRKVMTEYISDPSHWSWSTYYNSGYTKFISNSGRPGGGDNMNIYQWMLTKSQSIL